GVALVSIVASRALGDGPAVGELAAEVTLMVMTMPACLWPGIEQYAWSDDENGPAFSSADPPGAISGVAPPVPRVKLCVIAPVLVTWNTSGVPAGTETEEGLMNMSPRVTSMLRLCVEAAAALAAGGDGASSVAALRAIHPMKPATSTTYATSRMRIERRRPSAADGRRAASPRRAGSGRTPISCGSDWDITTSSIVSPFHDGDTRLQAPAIPEPSGSATAGHVSRRLGAGARPAGHGLLCRVRWRRLSRTLCDRIAEELKRSIERRHGTRRTMSRTS